MEVSSILIAHSKRLVEGKRSVALADTPEMACLPKTGMNLEKICNGRTRRKKNKKIMNNRIVLTVV